MSVTTDKYIIQNMEMLSFFSLEDNSVYFIADDLQEATMSNDSEIVYAEGKNGVRIGASERNKTSNITATNGTIVEGALAVQVGSDVETGTTTIPNQFFAIDTADGVSIDIVQKPIGDVGNEIPFIYKKDSSGGIGKKYAISSNATATTFKYDPSTKKVTLPTGQFAAGDTVYLFYDIEVANAKTIANQENKFSKTGMLVADIFAKDVCTDKSYYGKIIYHKAKASGTFELSFGNDPSVQNLEFEAMSIGCGSQTKKLWTLVIYDGDDVTLL